MYILQRCQISNTIIWFLSIILTFCFLKNILLLNIGYLLYLCYILFVHYIHCEKKRDESHGRVCALTVNKSSIQVFPFYFTMQCNA
ncbi:hypothetical protein GDO86_008768 [Hymenochirus boettgeri]|uniref:Uncharacterized protein n=1 Tax=Hymenochirus boettgeri TaxID=247094 RepID=A0A8T2J1Q4_9PIPI|nr:hypothetical protein GDO86_008768 [Hymenochirus boettgeri]